MAYSFVTDFVSLLRSTGGGMRSARMPSLDFVLSALNRAGIFNVSVSTTAPVDPTVVWVTPATPSWSSECVVKLYNAVVDAWQVATPTLWNNFLAPSGYNYQSLEDANNIITAGVSLAVLNRGTDPAATAVALPAVNSQFPKRLQVADYSDNATLPHTITLTPADITTKIMRQASWQLVSTTTVLASIELTPCPELNAWIIAP